MAKIYMSDLAVELMALHGLTKREAQQFLSDFVEIIQEGVARDRMVKIRGLGTFKVIGVEARESVNVNTGERVTIDGHSKLTFSPDASLKELVNKPFSQFDTVVLNDGVTFDDLAEADAIDEPSVEEPSVDIEEPSVDIEEPSVDIEEPSVEEFSAEEDVQAEESPEPEAVQAEEPVIEEPAEPEVVQLEEPVIEEPAEPEAVQPEEPLIEEPTEPEAVQPEEPVAEETPAPQVAPLKSTVPTEKIVAEHVAQEEIEEDDDEPAPRRSRWWLWLLLALAACGLCFYAGYRLGMKQQPSVVWAEEVEKEPTVAQRDSSQTAKSDTTAKAAAVDSVKAAPADTSVVSTPVATATAGTPTSTVSTPAATTAADGEEDYKKYEAMDQRVRTGAYNIIGTAEVIKAKKGDNTRSIARRTIGQGMECYIEVYNGLTGETVLSEGQQVKIPKLRVKKAARSKFRKK